MLTSILAWFYTVFARLTTFAWTFRMRAFDRALLIAWRGTSCTIVNAIMATHNHFTTFFIAVTMEHFLEAVAAFVWARMPALKGMRARNRASFFGKVFLSVLATSQFDQMATL